MERSSIASDVDAPVRVMRAMPRVRGLAGALAVAMGVGLADVGLAVAGADAVAVQAGDDGGEEEEDGVEDAEGEGGLEHGARLVDVDAGDAVDGGAAEDAEAHVHRGAAHDVGAVGVGQEPLLVHGPDEGADEQDVDDGDEDGVGRGPVVREEREHGPGRGYHRHDEEH